MVGVDPASLCAFVASLAIVAMPGPSVLYAISPALAGGRRAGLLAALGNGVGLCGQVLVIALGMHTVAAFETVCEMLGLAGAGYLVWLGARELGRGDRPAAGVTRRHRGRDGGSAMREGFVVGFTNPKSLLLLAALLPAHVGPGTAHAALSVGLRGALFCLLAVAGDSAWVMLTARARDSLVSHPRRLRALRACSGGILVALGLVLLLGPR